MENRQKTPSVIAKLMGFDEMPPRRQPVYGRLKVLSDNYLQKSGSIGKRSRYDSLNKLLRSKKKASLRTDNTNKDILSRDIRHKSSSYDGMQGMKSPVGENGKSNRLTTKIVDPRPNFGNVQYASRPSFLLDSRTVFAWEVKKQLLERLKMTKVSQKLQLDFGSSIGIKRKESRKYDSLPKLPIFERLNFSFNSNYKTVKITRSDVKPSSVKLVNDTTINTKNDILVSEPETKNVELFHDDTEDKCNYSAKEVCSCHLSDLASEQDSPISSYEDGSLSSNCVQIDEELPDIKIEMYQRSPNSVLEPPFREDNSSSSEYCESANTEHHGLWMQLQLLKSKSEENDNPEMITSSDDERSCTDQNVTQMISFGTKESRDFSYLVDVLDESGFQDGNVEIHFERWHSSECMASPSVFETLEKKYGKQELWHISERKLLFDRINSGMTEILRPQVDIRDCYNPLSRKMTNILRRDVIEEELLALLLSQEKEVNDGVSEKAVGRGRWFDPVDELDSLVREIEIFLFEELVAELVSA